MITVTVLDENCKLRGSSLFSFPQPPIASCLLGPDILSPHLFFQGTSVLPLQSEIIFLGKAFGHTPGYELCHLILFQNNFCSICDSLFLIHPVFLLHNDFTDLLFKWSWLVISVVIFFLFQSRTFFH